MGAYTADIRYELKSGQEIAVSILIIKNNSFLCRKKLEVVDNEATIDDQFTCPGKAGKTVFTAGLLRVCSRRGLKVQPYKCGPDSMDAQLLALAGNRDCINLDTWLASRTHTQQIYNEYGEYADVCITEGKGGLFDGHDGIKGSSAELAAWSRFR